jgi:hypothetical protein
MRLPVVATYGSRRRGFKRRPAAGPDSRFRVDVWAGHRGAITPSGSEPGRGPAWGLCGRLGAMDTSAATVRPMGRCKADAPAAAHLNMMLNRPSPPRVAAAKLKGIEALCPSCPAAAATAWATRGGEVDVSASPRHHLARPEPGRSAGDHPHPSGRRPDRGAHRLHHHAPLPDPAPRHTALWEGVPFWDPSAAYAIPPPPERWLRKSPRSLCVLCRYDHRVQICTDPKLL